MGPTGNFELSQLESVFADLKTEIGIIALRERLENAQNSLTNL
jgi:hypothetical protein